MKILFITPFPPPMGGISNWSKLVIDYLNEDNNVEVKYINTAPKKRSTEGRTLFSRISNGFFSILKTTKQLKKELKQFKPDVVHINTSGSLALFRDIKVLKILKKNKVKSLLHIRFGRVPEVLINNNLESKLLKKAFSITNNIITIDNKTYDAVSKQFSDKTYCIPNPFVNDKMPKPNLLTNSNCNNTITFLGWVVKTKGIEELLSAWTKVYSSFPSWKLNIIGPYDEKYCDYLKSKFSFEGVQLIGEKSHDEAMDIVNNSDIFVLPSYTEGFPNVILEAMYLGKAIIATDVGAIPEMLSDECGIVIKKQSINDIVDSLINLIENRKILVSLGNNANKKCEQYSICNVMKQYKNVWLKK